MNNRADDLIELLEKLQYTLETKGHTDIYHGIDKLVKNISRMSICNPKLHTTRKNIVNSANHIDEPIRIKKNTPQSRKGASSRLHPR